MSLFERKVHNWTEEDDATLMELMSEEWTFGEIAVEMDLERDQVSSRFLRLRHKMGWQAA